jgi:hypothetical protein
MTAKHAVLQTLPCSLTSRLVPRRVRFIVVRCAGSWSCKARLIFGGHHTFWESQTYRKGRNHGPEDEERPNPESDWRHSRYFIGGVTIMKNIRKLAVLSFMLLGAFEAMAQEEDSAFLTVPDANVAGVTSGVTSRTVLPTAISIDVLTELKVDTTVVTASSPRVPSIDGFWVVFAGPTWTKAVVTIQPKATGLLESSITLVYLKPTGATGTFYAPFSISDWTGSTSGTGTATVTFWHGTTLLGGANHTFTLQHN